MSLKAKTAISLNQLREQHDPDQMRWTCLYACYAGKKTHEKDRKLISVTTYSACETTVKSAEESGTYTTC